MDTDTHHADGVRDLFYKDEEMLHICFCGGYGWDQDYGSKMQSKTKFCFPHGFSDDEEVANVQREVPDRIREFKPELIYWLCGMDTHKGSYGTQALSEKAYPRMAQIIKGLANEVCGGKLIVKTCCNAPPYATQYIVPRLVDQLAELNKLAND